MKKIIDCYFALADNAKEVCDIIKTKGKNPSHIVINDNNYVLFFIDEKNIESKMDNVY